MLLLKLRATARRKALQISKWRTAPQVLTLNYRSRSYSEKPSTVTIGDAEHAKMFDSAGRQLSWRKGPQVPPLLSQTIPQHFASIVSSCGDRTAVISRSQGQRLTYEELDSKSNQLARGLKDRMGVRKGDRVAVNLGNNIEFAVTTYALFKLGAVLVPLNPAFNVAQVVAALSHLEAAHLIIGAETNLPFKPPRENVTLLTQITPSLLTSKTVVSAAVPSLQSISLVDNSSGRVDISLLLSTTPFDQLSAHQPPTPIEPDIPLATSDIINIQFTSGTTSTPKAACLTHTSILNNGFSIGSRMGLTPTDVVCCPPPLFHCFGSILGYMATATHGAALLLPAEAFDPRATLLAAHEERATALYGVATMFVAELELLASLGEAGGGGGIVAGSGKSGKGGGSSSSGFEHLRTGIAAGSSVPSRLMAKLHDQLNLTGLTICYGMTETSPVSLMTAPDDLLHRRLHSVGRLLPHVEAKVVSAAPPAEEDGNNNNNNNNTNDDIDGDGGAEDVIVPVGERGELLVSGYLVMEGYWGDAARTRAARAVDRQTGRAWMRTGDEAVMDAEGYVRITGRMKDLIIRGGENIHPLEVENCLFAHPSVSEVSVVGVPDERYGECVAAFVVATAGTALGPDDAGAFGFGFGDGDGALAAGERAQQEALGGRDAQVPGSVAARSELREEAYRRAYERMGGGRTLLTREDVRGWVREKLSSHLVPRYVFWVREYPKTASGKIQKFKLKALAVEKLGGGVTESEP